MLLSSMAMNLSQTKTLIVISSNAKTNSAPSTSMPLHSPARTDGEFENQLKLIPVMGHGIQHSGHRNVDEEFISTEILPKLCSDPKFTPKAIQNHLKEQYGVAITYSKAWRARERALNVINGSHEEAYNSLPKYCQEIQRSNPGSTVQLDIDQTTNRFKRLFICFAAS